MQNMSLSAYVYGVAATSNATVPTPPQPNINDILTPEVKKVSKQQTQTELLDYIERDVDVIQGEDF